MAASDRPGPIVTTVPLGPVDLAVAEAGRGGSPLLLVHGFTGAKEDFGDWMERFAAEGWWVVAPDLRGHGASSAPDDEGAYSLDHFARDLVALVSALGWDRCSMVGHSMGGMVAQTLVCDHPVVVDRLVLMDTHHGPVDGLDPELVAVGLEVLRTQGLAALLELRARVVAATPSAAEVHLRATRPGYAEWADAKVHACAPAMYAAMGVELTSRPDRLADLASVRVPTRVVVGAEDHDFSEPCHRLAATIPDADLVVVPGAGHSPQFENPEAWWRAVAPFLAADGSTAPPGGRTAPGPG
jgi:3-oxoadipate enol-lactonase